jgi:hypothetical protein
MMFSVFEDHETWSEGQIKLHPDQQIVQYVLPCFVASLLEFADSNDVDQKDKETYVKIVHELIKSYEVDPFKVSCMDGSSVGAFSPYYLLGEYLHCVTYWQAELLIKGLQKALGSSPKAIKIAKTLDEKFIAVLLDTDNTQLDLEKAEKTNLHLVWIRWRLELYRLFRKVMEAIEAAVPGCLPNLKALEITAFANISYEDHTDVETTPFTNVSLSTVVFNVGKIFQKFKIGVLFIEKSKFQEVLFYQC